MSRAVPRARAALLASLALLVGCARQPTSEAIRLNQVGYYPAAPKVAIVAGEAADSFEVVRASGRGRVLAGRLQPRASPTDSATATRAADFSALAHPGSYFLFVPGLGRSYPFEVRPNVYEELTRAALKGFWYQRASTALERRYAGPWSRPAGHPDTVVLVHPSAASPGRPAGTVISAPAGWYDAGDYNKYIVNSGISTATLLSLYEDFPAFAQRLEVGTPDSGDAVPDLLQEAVWNLRWMLSMQDPGDGGVYHKLTEASFSGMVMPDQVDVPRYVVQKSTAAALNFAAVMAQASRVLRSYPQASPVPADSLLAAALHAWNWARRNPDVRYEQDEMNRRHDPDIVTGAYGDNDLRDEFAWAAAELFATTRQDSFFTAVPVVADEPAPVPSWSQVRTLGYYTLARSRPQLPAHRAADVSRAERLVVAAADSLLAAAVRAPYGTPMDGDDRNFIWGSSAVAANQGILLVTAYRLTNDRRYLNHALANMDYLLGRNATGFSFVTGHGDRTPQHPHHRPSAGDQVEEPVPGLLAGGPNPARQDQRDCPVPYPSLQPATAYLDHVCSYASNEIAINWNAPLVYLGGALEALQQPAGLSSAPAPRTRR